MIGYALECLLIRCSGGLLIGVKGVNGSGVQGVYDQGHRVMISVVQGVN